MCNACHNVCCGSDQFEKCGCDGCECEECWSDEPEEMDDDDQDYGEPDCVTPQDTTPPELKAVLGDALAARSTPTDRRGVLIVTRKKGERELFGIVVQPRVVELEKPLVYAAILKLRKDGLQVFRAGRHQHLVRNATTCRGRKVTTAQLLKLAGPILSSPAELIG